MKAFTSSVCGVLLLTLLLSPSGVLAQEASFNKCLALGGTFENRHTPEELAELARACGFTPQLDPTPLMTERGATCNPILDVIPCTIDLRFGLTSFSCFPPFYTITAPPTDSDADGWLEMVLKVDLTPDCSEVCVVLEYEGRPSGWTLDFGDSETNNGFGGNSGSDPTSLAELEIQDETLRVWSDALGPGMVDQLATRQLRLTDSSYKVCVSNQHIKLGQPAGAHDAIFSELLYALPDVDVDDNNDLYIGLNRVILSAAGAPVPSDRIGAGLRRAFITVR